MPSSPRSCSIICPSDGMGEAHLGFEVAGRRSVLVRQHVPYPFHVTRPFYLDAGRPDIATLYLQSSSGGLYRGEQLGLGLELGPGAAAHVTTQAATVVHDCRGDAARYRVTAKAGANSFLAFTPEPAILLPGAWMDSRLSLSVEPGAKGIIADGFLTHDPVGEGASFDQALMETRLLASDGTLLACDRQAIRGDAFADAMAGFRCLGNAVIFGLGQDALSAALIEQRLDTVGCFAGASPLPGLAGLCVRLMARDGAAFRAGLTLVFEMVFEATHGIPPAQRRK